MPQSTSLVRRTLALVATERANALVERAKGAARVHVPLAVRIERKRLMRVPEWLLERSEMASTRTTPSERARFVAALATKHSPMCRGAGYAGALQRAKEQNVRRVAGLVNGILLRPGEVFSYHHVVGRPSVLRGFAPGPELREGKLSTGVGGGACQVTNMLFQLGLLAGLDVVERHRHGLDLFPDTGRTVPFGCGATVFYNMADLRLRNPHPFPIVWRLCVRDGELLGALIAAEALQATVEVYEAEHGFEKRGGEWWRENRVNRRFLDVSGAVLRDEEVLRNVAQTAYTPQDLSSTPRSLSSDVVRWDSATDRLRLR